MTSHRPHPKAPEPQMEVAAFEDAAAAGRHGVRMEFLYGRLGVKALPDGDHLAIIGIPIYLLVDRDAGQTVVFSCPEEGTYTQSTVHFFGQDVKLAAPVSMVLETDRFPGWVR